jgi:hypothetical protein
MNPQEIEICQPTAYELEDIRHFATQEDEPGIIDTGQFFAQYGDQPLPFRLRDVYEQFGKTLDLRLYRRFEIWVVPHRIGIIRRSGNAEVTSVGIRVEFKSDEETCSIISLLPAFKYIIHGKVGADVSFGGTLTAAGEAKIATPDMKELDGQAVELSGIKFSAGTDNSANANIGFHYVATISTPSVSAIGEGSSRCEWRIDKDVEPLFGKTIDTFAIIALPKRKRTLQYDLSFYINTRTLWFPTRRESKPVTVTCDLA